MEASWISIIPFLVVIPISIFTKQVLPGLLLGLLVGSYLVEPSLVGGMEAMLKFVVQALIDENNIKIIVFLYAFSGLVGIIKITGGIRGFVEAATRKVKNKKHALLLTYLSTVGTFSAPTFRFVTIAPIMRALLKKVKMSAQELGFVIETTATPVIVLIPIATAFVGYMVSIVQISTDIEGIKTDPYLLFLKSIPYNFFAIVIILLGIYLSFFHPSKSHTVEPEPDNKSEKDWHECHPAVSKELPEKPWNLIFPLLMVILLTLCLTWWSGSSKGYGFLQSFIKADVLDAMVIALLITIIVAFVFYLFQKFKLSDLITNFIAGGNELMSVILLLSVVWGLASVTDELGFSKFVTKYASLIPASFITPLLFLFGCAVSYFIGSAWGTWGILMPLGISVASASDVSIPLIIGTVFASGSFGAFASPLSDDSNTIAKILDLSVIDYAKYKLKPALIATGISTVLYAAASFIF